MDIAGLDGFFEKKDGERASPECFDCGNERD
jgi:hypothetical protein